MAERQMPPKEEYPNASDVARERPRPQIKKQENKKEIVSVTKGKVKQKKRPFARKFAEAFGAEEGQGVIDYILYDIIVPATKDMLLDTISNGAEMALYGEVRGRRRRSGSGSSHYSYDRVSYRNDYRSDRRGDRRDREDRRQRADPRVYEDIIFDSKADAEEVISGAIDMIENYGQVSVLELFQMSGITGDYAMGNYGWTNLSSATVRRSRDGYILDLPRPIVL